MEKVWYEPVEKVAQMLLENKIRVPFDPIKMKDILFNLYQIVYGENETQKGKEI